MKAMWKDATFGCILAKTDTVNDLLDGTEKEPALECCPMSSVPTYNPDRTVATKRRHIHDLQEANEDAVLQEFPQVTLPTVPSRCRGIAKLNVLWPGLDVYQSKCDGESAFRRQRTAAVYASKQGTRPGSHCG